MDNSTFLLIYTLTLNIKENKSVIGLICLITVIIPIYNIHYTIKNKNAYSRVEYIFRIFTFALALFLLLRFAVKFLINP